MRPRAPRCPPPRSARASSFPLRIGHEGVGGPGARESELVVAARELARLGAHRRLEGLRLLPGDEEGGGEQHPLADLARRWRAAAGIVRLRRETLEHFVGAVAGMLDHLARGVVLLLPAQEKRRARSSGRYRLRLLTGTPQGGHLVE